MAERGTGRPGRPPKGPIAGKGATLATRITAETRRALDAEAERTGRSVSQVVEIFLERAIRGNATFQEMVGGNATLEAAMLKLAQIARALDEAISDKWLAHFVLMDTWEKAIAPVLSSAPVTPAALAEVRQNGVTIEACQGVLNALASAGSKDAVGIRSRQPTRARGSSTIADLLGAGAPLAVAGGRCDDLISALDALRKAGRTARAQIDEALSRVRAVAARDAIQEAKRIEAGKIAAGILAKITAAPQ